MIEKRFTSEFQLILFHFIIIIINTFLNFQCNVWPTDWLRHWNETKRV